MVLADFSGIPAGTKGIVSEIYDEGVMIAWIGMTSDLRHITEESIREAIAADKCYPAAGYACDGFSRDELEYLAFETDKKPLK